MNLTRRIKDAIDLAYSCHNGFLDKNNKPYFTHVMRVALAVEEYGEDYFVTALLHDVVEDCSVSLDEIETKFGKVIRDALDSVSRREGETYQDFILRSKQNPIGRVVKVSDLGDNMNVDRIAALPEKDRGIIYRYEKALCELMKD